jgi:hypothetical protein
MRLPTVRSGLAALLLAALPAPARSVDVADGKLTLHADGQWAYQRTFNQNSYGEASPDGNYQTALFDLTVRARPAADVVINAQLGFDPEGVELEWGFVEWRLADQVRLRIGKVFQPFGNFTELRFAGTARAFFDLPTSIYGPATIAGDAYFGAGVTGQLHLGRSGWTLLYDAYGGAMQISEFEPYTGLLGETGPAVVHPREIREMVGGRLSFTAPNDLVLRYSMYGGRMVPDEDGSWQGLVVYGVSAEWRNDDWWTSAELFHTIELGREHSAAAYLSVARFVTPQLQLAGRLDWRTTFPRGVGSSRLLEHREAAVGVNYWVTPEFALKSSFHLVDGNRFAVPMSESGTPPVMATPPVEDLAASPPGRLTQALTIGTQFSF